MTTVTFLLSKDPVTQHGGDLTLSRLVIGIAAEAFDVDVICLSEDNGAGADPMRKTAIRLTRVPKPLVNVRTLAVDSIRSRRSMVHVRYDTDPLLAAIEAIDSDVFAAEHNYMAETFLRSAHAGVKRLVVNTVNTESQVWRATRGLPGRIEARRIIRDEVRVARAADAVGTYDAEEAEWYRSLGVPGARWIDLTMEPTRRLDLSSTDRRLVFMGTRDWPPNQEAFLEALKLWPKIAAGIPGAQLVVIGAKKPGASDPQLPEGVTDLGFVDDLPQLLATSRAMIAPIKTGGGVRVKILDAARMGLPVVGTSAAIGSLAPLLGLTSFDGDDAFVAECRRYLLDDSAAPTAGGDLYERNAARWAQRLPHRAIEDLLRG